MRKLWKVLPLLAFAWITVTAATRVTTGATTNMPAAIQSSDAKVAHGELEKVDTDNKTLSIKLQNGGKMDFEYDSSTVVEGRENGVQGLSGETGTRLAVHYTEKSGKMLATKIVIQKSSE